MGNRLQELIEVSLGEGRAQAPGGTLVVENHLAQMVLFIVRKGIELLPEQDDRFASRKLFIDKIWRFNKLDCFLERIVRLFCARGKLLFYMRPTEAGEYEIDFFERSQFRDYYDRNRQLEKVIIVYSYQEALPGGVATDLNILANPSASGMGRGEGVTKWVKLVVTADEIKTQVSDSRPGWADLDYGANAETFTNPLGFIPCSIAVSSPTNKGGDGEGDFDRLAGIIEGHDMMTRSSYSNLRRFGNPTLVTTRSEDEMFDSGAIGAGNGIYSGAHATVSSNSGFYGANTPSTFAEDLSGASEVGGAVIRSVIGGVTPDERFGYISPDPITPDHYRHIRETREQIHWALGGLDELGISASATAYELKTIFGRVEATAYRRAQALYEYGLCPLFEMAIAAEEDLFKKSYVARLNSQRKEGEEPIILSEEEITQLVAIDGVPPNVFGLPPLGSRKVNWRWTGPVFSDSPRDRLDKSIVARNFQELGIGSKEALRTVFEDRTDDELEAMLSGGFPFRYAGAIMSSTQGALQLLELTRGIPDPENQGQPLALRFLPIITRAIDTLYQELSYADRYRDADPTDVPNYPTGLAPYERAARELAGLPPVPDAAPGGTQQLSGRQYPSGTYGNTTNPFVPDRRDPPIYSDPFTAPWYQPVSALANAGIVPGIPAQSNGAGLGNDGRPAGAGPRPSYAATTPGPGTVVPSAAGSVYGTSLGSPRPSAAVPGGLSIPPDLAVNAAQPGSIYRQLAPSFDAILRQSEQQQRSGGKPKRSRGRKSGAGN